MFIDEPSSKYIFFLNLEEKLPKYFFELSAKFSSRNVSLVPISIKELQRIPTAPNVSVLTVTRSFSSLQTFQSIRRVFLDVAIQNKKYLFFHLTSFSVNDLDFANARRWGYYYNYKLPVNMDNLASDLSDILCVRWDKTNKWPGGTRVPLDKTVTSGV